jgi:CcmD family protein
VPQNLAYLFAAFAVTWVGLFAYVLYVQKRLTDATDRMNAIEQSLDEREGQQPGSA